MSSQLDHTLVQPKFFPSRAEHLGPLTPPSSSLSDLDHDSSFNPDKSRSPGFEGHIDVEFEIEENEDGHIYDEDDEDEMYDEHDDDQHTEGFKTARMLASEQYDQLSSLRDTSPNEMLLFSADESDFDTLEPIEARELEAALIELSGPISSTLTQYRHQFDAWESSPNPPLSVIKASTLIDQCLAQFVYSLEPLQTISRDLLQLSQFLQELHSFLNGKPLSTLHQDGEICKQLWNGLCQLADQTILIEDTLSDTTNDINGLCDWVDGSLTPALAEVKFPSFEQNTQVSQILDVHSYLCESLVKACKTLKIYLSCLNRISHSISRFQSILTIGPTSNDQNSSLYHPSNGFDPSSAEFPIDRALDWSDKWAECLTSIINSLCVFRAISDCIQTSTSGRFTSSHSSTLASDEETIYPSHCILY